MNCLDIITRALRRIGVVGTGQLPREQEQDDALDYLKAIYRRLISSGAFGTIREVHPNDTTYKANAFERVVSTNPTCVVTLPDTARSGAVVCVVDTFRNQVDEYVFDGHTQKWTTIDDLDLTSPAPLAHGDPTGLAAYLALELADEYGQTPSTILMNSAAHWVNGLQMDWSRDDPNHDRTRWY